MQVRFLRSRWQKRMVVALCALGASGCASHMLGCDEQPTPRSREICEALAAHSEITLGIKSIPHPQWRSALNASEAIYCELDISAADAPELKQMSRRPPQALALVADDLYQLVTPTAPHLWRRNDPKSQDYRLKHGCPDQTSR